MFFIGFFIVLAVIAALAVGVDVAARAVAEHQVASRAKASTGAQSSSASISSFPFIYGVLVDGKVKNVTVHEREVALGPLTVGNLDVSVHDVRIDKGQLFAHRKVRVTGISSATASITISAADITAATHVYVTISGNTVTGFVAGVPIPVAVSVTHDHFLSVSFDGRPAASFDLARNPLLPPCAMQLTPEPSALRLSCTVSPVPGSLIAALSSRS